MKAYLLTLAGVIILSAVVSILVSDGKMGKFIKGMTRLFVFSVVILPLASLFGEKNFTFEVNRIGSDEGYLLRCATLLAEADEKAIVAFLSEEYSLEAEAEVERSIDDNFPRKKIVIKIGDGGIFEPDEHIDMTGRIQAVLEQKFGCQTEVIWLETG